ncbi:hypothetical protein DEIPH_ctg011orf0065 [Deinococcus phoenicis]|uniref:Resolvase/invertase-type recombinase catalytic domain-containing protein n=1 Tax=Deinococcus phoenicis TaxID=1476583 RepID=A0A016QTB0_9DEIO|nr:recombinase family protein [Deinococcus phoenicis]EYB69097.1 hypothetical protein DEIPH_ctg011orf0065 [Deinococcus phoenicis]
MTARLYSRVSSRTQVTDGFSLPAQRAKLQAWADYQGLTPVQHYEDAGLSGKRDDRPGLAALLLDLQPGDVVATYSLSRLARGGAVQLLGIVRDIRDRGARLVFLAESIDTDTPTGRLMLTILAALAELEIEQTRERTEMGRTEAASQGIYPHGRVGLPTGWTKDEAGRLVEEPAESAVVRLALAQGQQAYHLTATQFNDQGIKTRWGGKWSATQIRRIVQFEGYWTGELVYRAASRPDEPEQHVTIPAPALVSREVWEAAQRDRTHNHPHRQPDQFPLTGHLRCGCGARLTGKSNQAAGYQRRPIYLCHPTLRKTPKCGTNSKASRHYGPAEELNHNARAALAAHLCSPNDPARIADLYRAAPAADPHAAERQDITRKLEALVDLYLEQMIDRATYEARRATLTARLAQLQPVPPAPPAEMPDLAAVAEAILTVPNAELAELLDIYQVEFLALGGTEVRVVGLTPP